MILITGHKGYIGSHLIKHISDYIGLDIIDGNDILNCKLPDVDVVIHLAAQSKVLESMENPFKSAMVNVAGTVRLAERYKDAKFIFASTGGAIQDEIISPYGLSKYHAEEYIKLICKDYVILRLANVYGGENSSSVVDKFLNNDIVIYGDGSQTRNYVHVDDIVRAFVMAINWEKGTYTVGGGDDYSVLDIAKQIGKEITFIDKKKGELDNSIVKNTTPNWKPEKTLDKYIASYLQGVV